MSMSGRLTGRSPRGSRIADLRLPNTSNISFEFIEGEGILLSLDMENVAASSGSARWAAEARARS